MDAHNIPNLNTLKTSRGRGGGLRSRALRLHQSGPYGEASKEAKDAIIQNTDQDAAQSRLSAVELGYLNDPFAKSFVQGPPVRRYPIINRGTYVRTTAIDHLIQRFLSASPSSQKQIISLGAGTDTRYFRLVKDNPDLRSTLIYHELDFPTTTIAKVSTVQRNTYLRSFLPSEPEFSSENSYMYTPTYNVHALDLRDLAIADPASLPNVRNLRRDIPTLLLSECCLIYLLPAVSTRIISSFTTHFLPTPVPLALVLYEPIHPHDPFGRIMVSNLSQRGIVLESLETFHDLDAQRKRLKDAGFDSGQEGRSVLESWRQWIVEEEKERVAGCEMVDEIEEWELLAGHYSICWGWRDGHDNEDLDVFSRAWKDLRQEG
ncbi:leucine carboxyl methyltransferase 1 [Viridothelium virens]|uniref:Leucine carboxyl methyltransferase 1 n=1 Tax=Viridothelium virens TaxID=1048519 RepID=A0A6A6HDV5_VIRVR|nr:leucine carboxyl methyltransferase 1 [Viridothelium virens]